MIDDRFLLDLDRLQHPKRHIAEILTGPENAARHYAAELSAAAAEIHRILLRPGWGIEAGADETDLARAATKAAIASHRLIILMDRDLQTELPVVAPAQFPHLGWLFPLSAVLSVTTGRVLVYPAKIADLMSYMVGQPVAIDDPDAHLVAAQCSEALLTQHPGLSDVEAPPFPKNPGKVASKRPATISMYIERVAATLPPESTVEATGGEILVLVTPLTPAELASLDERDSDGTHPSE